MKRLRSEVRIIIATRIGIVENLGSPGNLDLKGIFGVPTT